MPRAAAPATYEDFRAYWRRRLASEELCLTEEARYIGYATAFEIPFPRHQQGAKRVHDAIMLGSMPPRVRELYRLRYCLAQQAAFNAAATAMRSGRRITPKPLARGYNTWSFKMVARTERRRPRTTNQTAAGLDDPGVLFVRVSLEPTPPQAPRRR